MEYKNFEEFYNKAFSLTQQARNKYPNTKEAIIYARKCFNKADLNSFYIVGVLKKEQIQVLKTKTSTIKLSIDSMIKNIIEHPDIVFKEYKNIAKYINSAEYILKKDNINLIYFKIENKIYQFVIKTT